MARNRRPDGAAQARQRQDRRVIGACNPRLDRLAAVAP